MALSRDSVGSLVQCMMGLACAGAVIGFAPAAGAAAAGLSMPTGLLEGLIGGGSLLAILNHNRRNECHVIFERVKLGVEKELPAWVCREFPDLPDPLAYARDTLKDFERAVPLLRPVEGDFKAGAPMASLNTEAVVTFFRAKVKDHPVFGSRAEHPLGPKLFDAIIGGTFRLLRETDGFQTKVRSYVDEALQEGIAVIVRRVEDLHGKVEQIATRDELPSIIEMAVAAALLKQAASPSAAAASPETIALPLVQEQLQNFAASKDEDTAKARQFIAKGEFDKGVLALETAIAQRREMREAMEAFAAQDRAREAENLREFGALLLFKDKRKAAEAYDVAYQLEPPSFWELVFLCRLFRDANDTTRALTSARKLFKIAKDERDTSVAHTEFGDIQMAHNQLDDALASYNEGLVIKRRLAQQNQNQPNDLRNLSVSIDRIGDIQMARNDLDGALASYSEGMEIARMLVAQDPSHPELQRDLSVSLNKVGDVRMARHELNDALACYSEGLEIARRLPAQGLSYAERQRDISVSLNRVGDVLMDLSRPDEALNCYSEGLTIRRSLVTLDPSNAERQRDFSTSLERIGDIKIDRNDFDGALSAYREGLGIFRRLASTDPSNDMHQRDVCLSLLRVATVFELQLNSDDACTYYREAAGINARLRAAAPDVYVLKTDAELLAERMAACGCV